jgi:microcystin-dependent protein
MPIETFNFIDSLNSANPGSSDDVLQGDDHIRGIKSVLKNSFPNLAAAANFTAAQVNQLVSGIITFAAGSSGSPSIIIGDAASAFYRVSSGVIGFVGRLSGNGAVDVGSMHFYPFAPPGGMASGGSATGTERYVLADGSVYSFSTFPELAALCGSSYGGNGTTTFGVPDLVTANRFIRAAGGSVSVGMQQADAIKTHSATLNGTAASHSHGVTDPTHSHGVSGGTIGGTGSTFIGSGAGTVSNVVTGPTSITVSGNGTGVTINASGALGLSGSADYSGASETRPAAFGAYVCLKT